MSDVLATNLRRSAEADAQRARMRSKPREAFILVLDGLEISVSSGRASRSIDTVADGWTAEIAWTPGRDKELDKRLAPYAYPEARVYLGSNLVNTGRLYAVASSLTASGRVKNLEGWSLTADLVDSHVPASISSGQWSGLSVWNLANALCRPLGIGVRTDIGNVTLRGQSQRVTEPFDEVKASLTESYAELLTRLAAQRGMLVSCDELGNLFLTAARTSGAPIANLEEGKPPAQKLEAKFDGRKRFHKYTVYGQSGMADDIRAEAMDPRVPSSRVANILAPEVTAGNARVAAGWKRSKQLAEALSIPLPATGWYAPRGELWAPNTLVTLTAPSLHVVSGFTFLIRSVEYLHETQGQTSMLQLVPPQVYTGEPIEEPWA